MGDRRPWAAGKLGCQVPQRQQLDHARRVRGVMIIHSHGAVPTKMPTSAALCRHAITTVTPDLIRDRASTATTATATGTSATVSRTT